MTSELNITIPTDEGRVIEACVEVTAIEDGRAWDFTRFYFTDVFLSDLKGDGEFLDTMPDDMRDAAEEAAEQAFLAERQAFVAAYTL